MDPTTQLTHKDKCLALLSLLEEYMHNNQKRLPPMLKMMYKPALNTMTALLLAQEETDLQHMFGNIGYMLEAVACQYTDRRDFIDHMQELFAAWI